jgi:taurine dioxygenase
LVLSGQHIDLAQQRAFARIFGELEQVLSHRLAGNNDTAVVIDNKLYSVAAAGQPKNDFHLHDEFQNWHVDSSYCPEIPAVSVLRAEVLSPVGGMTGFASMGAAYDALSPTMQAWLETLQAIHAPPPGQRATLKLDNLSQEERDHWEQELSARLHPVVAVHPLSGRKGLFVNPGGFTIKIDKLSNSESAMLLRFLYNHCTRPEFTYRHLWHEGDILVWDELATTHIAPTDYHPHERRVVRVTAGLTAPRGVRQALAPLARAS